MIKSELKDQFLKYYSFPSYLSLSNEPCSFLHGTLFFFFFCLKLFLSFSTFQFLSILWDFSQQDFHSLPRILKPRHAPCTFLFPDSPMCKPGGHFPRFYKGQQLFGSPAALRTPSRNIWFVAGSSTFRAKPDSGVCWRNRGPGKCHQHGLHWRKVTCSRIKLFCI